MLIFTSDKKRLGEHFQKDPVLFAYHIGDLDEFYFPFCQWGATYGLSPRIDDVVLLYSGLSTPSVLAIGLTDKFPELLSEYLPLFPNRFHSHFRPEYRSVLQKAFVEHPLGRFVKMHLTNFASPAVEYKKSAITQLDRSADSELRAFFASAYPGTYYETHMLESGKYLGYRVDGQLVAVTGVHIDSTEYRIAVLGNIATRPEYRGRGLATALTAQLCEELLGENKMVCLNVKADNKSALACYHRLGFESVHEHDEALFEARQD